MLVASLSLCKWLNEWIAGAVNVSTLCTYGWMREIFESRYFRGEPNDLPDAACAVNAAADGEDADGDDTDEDEDGAAATANVHIKNTEL